MSTKNVLERSASNFGGDRDQKNIQVCVRMRPLLEPYEDEVAWEIDQESNTIRSIHNPKSLPDFGKGKGLNVSHSRHYSDMFNQQVFTFDNVEGPESRTREIYNKHCKRLVQSVLEGYNGTIFMYGQTTSGKTYSMLGTSKDPGILPHAMRTIFNEVQQNKEYTYHIGVSYLEIYNETINDLLVPTSTGLNIVNDPKYGVHVKGLRRQRVKSFEEAIYLMNFGEEHRIYRETNFNEHSSRSHTIYQVFLERIKAGEEENRKYRYSLLNLVDLAGSERLSDGDQNEDHLSETGFINKSLFLLTNLIKKLADDKHGHIPYRDSKLTRILSNALGGNSLTTIVCTVSPALMNYTQTLSTLRFASRAKKVRNKPEINEVDEKEAQNQLKQEIRVLLEKLHHSENEILKVNSINNKLEDNLQMTKQEILNLQKDYEELKAIFIKESFRQQNEEDPVNDEAWKDFSRRLKRASTAELLFGDSIINFIEQIINERSLLSPNSNATVTEINILRDWSIYCLNAKFEYLKELRRLQEAYADRIVEESLRYVPANQALQIQAYTKNYISSEMSINETISNQIWDALRQVESDSEEASSPEFFEKQPMFQSYDFSVTDRKSNSNYEEIVNKFDKRQEEVKKLATQQSSPGLSEILTPDRKSHNLYTDSSYGSPKAFTQQTEESGRGELNSADSIQNIKASLTSPKLDQLIKKKTEKQTSQTIATNLIGNTFLWGSGKDGRLGNGKNGNEAYPTPIIDLKFSEIVCGHHNTFGISQDSLVYAWGRNEIGQLGVGNYSNSSIPVNIVPFNTLKIEKITCGWQHSLALSSEGRVFSWGCGDEGQLGHGNTNSINSPHGIKFFDKVVVRDISCGHSQSAALTTENDLFTWGHNSDYRLMNPNPKNQPIPTLTEFHKLKVLSSGNPDYEIVHMSMGVSHMCIITKNGLAFTAGRGSEGQLGRKLSVLSENTFVYNPEPGKEDDSQPKLCSILCEVDEFGPKNPAIMSACGEKFTLILTSDYRIYSCGEAADGCLGLDLLETDRFLFKPTQISRLDDKRVANISAGSRHAACVTEQGELYCWGFNYYDQLGVGETQKNYHMQARFEIESNCNRPKKVDKLSSRKVVKVSCGLFHTACLTDNQEIDK